MSQLGSFCRKIIFLDLQHVDLAPQADSREVAAFLPLDQETEVHYDNLHSACTWFFRAKARLDPAKSWKDVLNSRKNWLEECLGVVSVIYFCICSHISRSDLGKTLVEGYVHTNANIWLGSLRHWLPMNHQELPELLEIEFEVILPGRKQHDQWYTKHLIFRNFLGDDTVRERSVDCKWIRVDRLKSRWIAWK